MIAMATGPYAVRDVGVSVTAVATNKVMMGPIRGSGGMVATFILERVLNQIAMRLALDQFSVRKANLVGDTSPDSSPFGATRPQLRSLELLERARNSRATREVLRHASTNAGPTLAGFGLAFYLAESAPPSSETVRLELLKSGKLLLYASVAPTGQGSERTLAAIISRKLRPGRSPVEVLFGDTTTSRLSIGTQSSRSITYAGSAALMACPLLVGRIKKSLAESSPGRISSVTFRAGSFHLRYRGGGGRDLDFVDAAYELGTEVAVEATYSSETSTYSLGCHISMAEVDKSTGAVRVLRHLTFDDFGTVLDPSALTAQSEGGALQSIGEALQEEVEYDQNGQLAGPYVIPSVLAKPAFSHTPIRLTTSQHLHGARGAGEAGRIGSLPAMVNAVENALSKARNEVFLASTPITDESLYAILCGR
jgi:carbon-monoxide dehydrogenase large subunit